MITKIDKICPEENLQNNPVNNAINNSPRIDPEPTNVE
jgi:hypothetical protein